MWQFLSKSDSGTFKNADFVFFLFQAPPRPLDSENPQIKQIEITPQQLRAISLNFDQTLSVQRAFCGHQIEGISQVKLKTQAKNSPK